LSWPAYLLRCFYSYTDASLLGAYDSKLFTYSSQSYLILSILSGICITWRLTSYATQAQLLIFSDILILTLIMHASGGINSGMGTLLAVSIAAGGLLIGGRCAMLFAALASLAVLTEQVVADYTHSFNSTSYANAGMLGAAFSPLPCCRISSPNVANRYFSLPINKNKPLLNWKTSTSTLSSICNRASLSPTSSKPFRWPMRRHYDWQIYRHCRSSLAIFRHI